MDRRYRSGVYAFFLAVAFLIAPFARGQEFDPPPGGYSATQRLFPVDSQPREYRFLQGDGTPDTEFFIPLEGSLVLPVTDGVSITYTIEVRRGDHREQVQYRLDRRQPTVPPLDPPPGVFARPVRVQLRGSDTVLYGVSGAESPLQHWPAEGLFLEGRAGEQVLYRIDLVGTDQRGVRSEPRAHRYLVDRTAEREVAEAVILSPVPGEFGNEQNLIVDTRGLSDVNVTIHSEQTSREFTYQGPQVISGSGTFRLELEALRNIDGERVSRSVSWTQTVNDEPLLGVAASQEPLRVSVATPVSRFTTRDRAVTARDPLLIRPFTVQPLPGADTVRVLRVAPAETVSSGPEERYAVLLQGFRPEPPIVVVDSAGGIDFLAPLAEEIYYHLGESATERVPEEGRRYHHTITCDSHSASETVLFAWARRPGGPWSQPTVHSVDRTACMASRVVLRQVDAAEGPLRLETSGAGVVEVRDESGAVFMEGRTVADGDASSVWVVQQLLPAGMRRTVAATLTLDGQPRGDSQRVTIDTAPPAPPEIRVDRREVTLSGSGDLYFSLDGTPPQRYEAPITLDGWEGVRRTYRITAFSEDSRQRSPSRVTEAVVDRRVLELPPVVQAPPRAADGTMISSGEELVFQFENRHDDMILHYQVSRDGSAVLPDADSPSAEGTIRIPVPEGEDAVYRIVVRGRFRDRDEWTPESRFTVQVDRVPPERPALLAPQNPVVSASSVLINFADPGEDEVYFRLSDETPFRRWSAPLVVAPPAEGEITYLLEAYTQDAAGNRSFLETPVTLTLGNPPGVSPRPLFDGKTVETGYFSSAREGLLELAPPSREELQRFWRVFENAVVNPTIAFREYDEPVILQDSTSSYSLETFYRHPEFGDGPIRRVTVTVDSRIPPVPAAPEIRYTGNGRQGTIEWTGLDLNRTFAALVADPGAPGNGFRAVTESMAWSFRPGEELLHLVWFSRSETGVRSETAVLPIVPGRRSATPVVAGVADGMRYPEPPVVTLTAGGLPVLYSVSTDGTEPPAVHQGSSRYREPLRFDTPPGDVMTVVLRYRGIHVDSTLTDEGRIRFVVDRQIPPVPQVIGIEPGGFYSTTTSFSFAAEDSAEVWYRIRRDDSESALPFQRYRGEVLQLPVVEGPGVDYRVDAFAQSAAGNRSQELLSVSVRVDRNTLFVDSSRSVPGDGSFSAPLTGINEALERAVREKRTAISLAPGRYRINRDLFTRATHGLNEVRILGARESAERATVVGEDDLALQFSGRVTMQDVMIQSPIEFIHGSLTLIDVRMERASGAEGSPSSTRALLSVSSGSAMVERSEVHGRVEIAAGGSLVATDSRVVMPADQHENSVQPLLSVRSGEVTIRNGIIEGSDGLAAPVIRAVDSRVDLSGSVILARGAAFSYGIAGRNSQVTLVNSLVHVYTLAHTEEGVAVATVGGAVTITHSLLEMRGVAGAVSSVRQLLNVDSTSTTAVVNSLIVADPGMGATGTFLNLPGKLTSYGSVYAGISPLLSVSPFQGQWQRRREITTVAELEEVSSGSIGNRYGDGGPSPETARWPGRGSHGETLTAAALILERIPATVGAAGLALELLPREMHSEWPRSDIFGVRRDPQSPGAGPVTR